MKAARVVLVTVLVAGGAVLLLAILSARPGGADDGYPGRAFRVSKACWPAWDTFQIGVERRERRPDGYRTTFIEREDYSSVLVDFEDGTADAATLTIFEAILTASRGTPLKIVLLLDYTTGSDAVVAAGRVKSLLDLRDGRVGVELGTIAHFTLLKAIEKAGLDRAEVELVDMSPDEQRIAFLSGELDAVATFEPHLSKLLEEERSHLIFSSAEIPRAICDVVLVREPVAREHPRLMDHWVASWHEALAYRQRRREDYLRQLSAICGMGRADLVRALDGIFLTGLAENRMALGTQAEPGYLLESLAEMHLFMLRQGVIEQTVDLEALIDDRAVRRFFRG